jgi:hypothetical protein
VRADCLHVDRNGPAIQGVPERRAYRIGNAIDVDYAADFVVRNDETALAVHDALVRLGALNPALAAAVECHFFAGYSESETARPSASPSARSSATGPRRALD